jgi:alkanesulfonate monooxygenase SsuD/methylene tetrahydromethanopterin reductase-like flavin-dependent oxidoreductase (luciferase family)
MLHFDMRAPDIGPPAPELYRAAVEMASWADERGLLSVVISEHHGSDDGYLPSPLVLAGAIAAVTKHAMISINALVLTLRDPVATAEDCLVLDNLSGGRLMLNLVAGYVPSEFEMFGLDVADRAATFEAKVAAFTQALTGEPFEWEGRTIRVTPGPVQRPRPMVALGGASKAGARRAARLGDGFIAPVGDQVLLDTYLAECEKLGKEPGLVAGPDGPLSIFVSTDPDATWERIGPHVLHELHAYGEFGRAAGEEHHPYLAFADATAAREAGLVAVYTPEECVEHVRSGHLALVKPLIGGCPPDVGWETLHLLVDEVLPKL